MNSVTSILRSPAGYLEPLMTGSPQLRSSLYKLRAEAASLLNVLPLPTPRDEEWRFTNISALTKLSFSPALNANPLKGDDIAQFYIKEATTRLVFVDGIYAPQLSSPSSNSGVVVSNLPMALATHTATIEEHLGRHIALPDNVFAALNTAFMHDAAVIVAPRNMVVEGSVHLLFIATQKESVSAPRCLLVAESGSSVTLIEDYVSLQDATHLVNPVTEVALADHAHVNHIRVQRDSQHAFHIANCAVSVGQSSNYQSVSIAMGAQISRYNLNVLMAEGAQCAVDGLALIADSQLADTHTCIDHTKAQGVSRQLQKCVIGGNAHAVFNGKIMVRQGAQRTDSAQSNRNLLLTDKAHVDTKPQLEIVADDVKCAHGATIGQLDSEEVFYLKSRGLSDSVACNLLTYAFAAEVIDRIPVASLKHQLQQSAFEQTRGQR